MGGFLALGFLIGMQHALEADHLAAVGAMAANEPASKRGLAMRGAAWGLGHTITLFAICSAVILMGLNLTGQLAAAMEFGVGIMLVLLGLDVIRRMRKKRVHFHIHDHGGQPHIHAHSHAGAAAPHRRDPHRHVHSRGFPVKALLVGLVHGAAGSAGLLALAVAATREPLVALGYVLIFGLGSILGMAALSLAAAWPLGAAERHAKLFNNALSIGAATIALLLGAEVMYESAPIAFSLL